MKTYRWLITLAAAIAITTLEAWIFTGESATSVQAATPDVVITDSSGGAQ